MTNDDWEYEDVNGRVLDSQGNDLKKGFYLDKQKELYFILESFSKKAECYPRYLAKPMQDQLAKPVIIAGSLDDSVLLSSDLTPVRTSELLRDISERVKFIAVHH